MESTPESRTAKWAELRERARIITRKHIGTLNRALNLDSDGTVVTDVAMKLITLPSARLKKDPPELSDEEILKHVKEALGQKFSIWD